MKAAVFMGPERMEVKEVPKPKCGEGEVLLEVKACAICGTDGRIYFHGQKNVVPPAILGHEIAGDIVEVGDGVEGYSPGDRVTVVTSIGCGHCGYCAKGLTNMCPDSKAIGYHYSGGFAEYMVVPAKGVRQNAVIKLPEGMPYEEAAMVEPLSCCINGQRYLNIAAGETVVVIGAGPIGSMHLMLAKTADAGKTIVVDIDDKRLKMVERFEPDRIVDGRDGSSVEKVMEETGGLGAEVVIVACGSHQAQMDALRMAAKMGRVSFFAGLPKDRPTITFDSNLLHYREISVFGAYASYRAQFVEALELISPAQGGAKIEAAKVITHRLPLERIVEGIVTTKKGEGLKSVIDFTGEYGT
ncbi:alcohol dehydrogenase catalytic domain-containing protein [bacterium]|nr:alcohol dehydrogenase catalytic domain-containing protein [bacterium]